MACLFPCATPAVYPTATASTNRPPRRLAADGLRSAQGHDGRARPRHQRLARIDDVAFDQADRPAALDHAPEGRQLARPHGLQEVDLELQRGARPPVAE